MNDPDDQTFIDYEAEAAARAALTANNTPEDDRLLAMRILRDIVTNPRAKPEARKAAADSLLKEAERAGTATDAEVQGYSYTDEQLLDIIRKAQEARAGAVSVSPAVPSAPAAPATPGASFLDALAGVPDIDPLCQ